MANTRPCMNFGCTNVTRGKNHDFCSSCWFKVSPMLRSAYYRARGSGRGLDYAVTNIIRALQRKEDADKR